MSQMEQLKRQLAASRRSGSQAAGNPAGLKQRIGPTDAGDELQPRQWCRMTVRRWSGREIRALRDAKRMSLREFAAHLGISDRMVSKWEAGGEQIHPRPVNQAALDTSLAQSSAEMRHRFEVLLAGDSAAIGAIEHVRHSVDGKQMVRIEAGHFLRRGDNDPLWLPAFYIDMYPATNADYARFIAATGHAAPPGWIDGTYPAELGNHPVVFVTWRDAAAYAHWAQKELPTSAQWEKTACGAEGKTYPWGTNVRPTKCNCRESGPGQTTAVDCYPSGTSPSGVYDLCGNVWEWTRTPSKPERYELKGGAFTSPFARAMPSAFHDAAMGMLEDDIGFRCVATEL
jgi:formylglycine-generating enzyme required for sulfatase activity